MGGASAGGSVRGTRSPLKIFANIFISFIGAGVLGLPYAFKQAGIAEGILIMGLVSFFSVRAMLLLIECKYTILRQQGPANESLLHTTFDLSDEEEPKTRKGSVSNGLLKSHGSDDPSPATFHEELSYGDVGYNAVGYWGQRLVEVSLLISQIGFCCAYLIFIAENLSSYMPLVPRHAWLFVLLPVLFLLTLFRELKKLAMTSLFAQISNIFAFAVVFWFDLEHIHYLKRMNRREYSLDGLPFFFAVSIYCFEGAGMILSLECSLAREVRSQFQKYFVTTIVFVTSLYVIFGSVGYLSFGPETNAIITLNLPRGHGVDFAMIVKLCLCVALFFTYPVMMFPVTEMLEKQVFGRAHSEVPMNQNLLRLCLVSCTGVIVVLIPSFADLMALVGATCCTMLAFVLPGLFHLRLHPRSLTTAQRYLDYTLIAIGLLGSIVGTLDTLRRLYAADDIPFDGSAVPLERLNASLALPANVEVVTPSNATFMSNSSSTSIVSTVTDFLMPTAPPAVPARLRT